MITDTVPGVKKAVKWNSPLYGIEDGHYFASIHCFDHYVKVTFFRGAQLVPVPPEASKMKDVRYLNVREGALDDTAAAEQLARWVAQAAALPGQKM